MGELEAAHLAGHGWPISIDEPYQHFQFAGRADLIAADLEARALLHIENRTRFPDIQAAAGAWNAMRTYLAAVLAERFGIGRGWASVTHAMVALWSREVVHTLRHRTATFTALCPDPIDAFDEWWSGHPPTSGTASTLVLLDPAAVGRQRVFVGLRDALLTRPRYRGYAEAVERLSTISEQR